MNQQRVRIIASEQIISEIHKYQALKKQNLLQKCINSIALDQC